METGLYYLQSRYYNPTWGRFLNADSLVSTGQGVLGYNMFAYCLNNPVCRKDIGGTISVLIHDSNGNHISDEKEYGGSGNNGGNSDSSGNGGKGISPSGNAKAGTTTSHSSNESGQGAANNYTGTSGKTEIHHIVERCQIRKSGFSKSQIESSNNKVELDYNLHRMISGYYSSKPTEFGGLRVRDWLAGQSFEVQTAFGWHVINMYYPLCI